ncbi:transcriptional regulator [Saccharomonospora sp. CUA-673]|uniref:TetR/AcrR family transcriptional regulator n=1 Tax=Saccharomonospora sp. CUA-673 TaxID=1904969 RepID=UPI0009647EC0|nr:TetR/AcrR family transcriptional regulator [Saccharomonospora sp. CUA-673]OLT45435.1 transcriptional regulator [Saccharomonospora sp. CUA-673]
MTERKTRKDAVRNREALLAAAAALYARSDSPDEVTMARVADEAGVGKGTLFRAFGDRAGLLRALYEARLEPVARTLEAGSPESRRSPEARIRELLDAVACFKLDNRRLAAAIEAGGGSSSPYESDHYRRWHEHLCDLLAQALPREDVSFVAHTLLAATRADLVEHLVGRQGMSRDELRTRLATLIDRIIRPEDDPTRNGP